ncbi:CaiB/BaiF CoA transferase family protein [Chloroflexota bacterium]
MKLPLEGIRICDLSNFWSGPSCTSYMGSMGAEVIKVESIQRPDGFRFGTPVVDQWWEIYGPWNSMNLNKYSLTLDLTRPRGVELFKELVKISDMVIENFPPRVMESFGLTYPVLKDIEPNIIMISMPGYGMTGPWRDYVGFGPIFEHVSGLAYITGYADGPPLAVGGAADPIVGMHAAFALLAALEYRRRTGKGQFIDLSQTELLTYLVGPAVIDYSLNHRVWGRMGNRALSMAPHGVYRCKGDDMWLAIAVSSDKEWQSFCHTIGNHKLAQDERFTTLTDRLDNQNELDRLIEEWTVNQDFYKAMDILQQAGVSAGVVTKPHEAPEEPHFKDRELFQQLTRDIVGTQLYPKSPVRLSETPAVTTRPAPKLGEHNDYVLGELLGISKAEMEDLEKDMIIGTRPLA